MMKTFALVVIAVSTIASAGTAQLTAGASAREPEITAIGRGETHLPPTFAVVMVGVSTRH